MAARPPVLSEVAVNEALSGPDGPGWQLLAGKLVKQVTCPDFVSALGFVTRVGALAEERNHHPDIDIRYNRVTLALITHDAGGITSLDLELARAIDGVPRSGADAS